MAIIVDVEKRLPGFRLSVGFEMDSGVMALLGASGCGKSMTLKCIAGLIKPDAGYIEVDGRVLFDSKKRIDLSPQARRVGLLFQSYALFPNMTVEQNVAAGMRRSGKRDVKRLSELLETFRLTALRQHYVAQLSGGQQQRAALARIIASEPAIIMLDEPLSALDSYLRWQLEQELDAVLKGFSGASIYVSHSRDEVYRLADKVCVISEGRGQGVVGAKELFSAPGTLSAALLSGCKNYSRAEKRGDSAVFAVDWNAELECAGTVPDDIAYIGVRAHYFSFGAQAGKQQLSCDIIRITDDLFGTIITLLPAGADQREEFSRIRMEVPKQDAVGLREGQRIDISVGSKDVMLLTGN